jgi:diguanylate cyclase (GGDEF)-like protein
LRTSDIFINKIDSWIPASIMQDEEQKLRARVIFSVMMICCGSVGLVFLTLLPQAFWGEKALWDGVFASLGVACVWYGGIVFLRRTANLLWASHLFAFIMYASTLGALLTSGGWSSPIVSLLLAVPAGIFLVAGRYVGLVWSVISAFTYYFLWLLHHYDVSTLQIVRDEHRDFLTVAIWCFSAFIMISCMTVYDRMAEILKNSLCAEREQYRETMTKDFLSKSYNRLGLQQHFEGFVERRKNVLFLYFNIANLSMINSELDYQAGDDLIRKVSLKTTTLFEDAAIVGRIIGGEFVVLIPGVPDRLSAEVYAKRLHQAFAEPFLVLDDKHELSVRGGIGAVLSLQDDSKTSPRNFRQILRLAHEAMQESDDQQNPFVIR